MKSDEINFEFLYNYSIQRVLGILSYTIYLYYGWLVILVSY